MRSKGEDQQLPWPPISKMGIDDERIEADVQARSFQHATRVHGECPSVSFFFFFNESPFLFLSHIQLTQVTLRCSFLLKTRDRGQT